MNSSNARNNESTQTASISSIHAAKPQHAESAVGFDLKTSIVNSQIAGLIMTVAVVAVFVMFLGKGPLYPMQVIASTFLGEGVLLSPPSIGVVLLGAILHLGIPCLFWGLMHGFAVAKFNLRTNAKLIGLGFGIAIAGMFDILIIVPTITRMLHGVDIWNREVPMFWSFAAHLVFGMSLALYPIIQQRLNRH